MGIRSVDPCYLSKLFKKKKKKKEQSKTKKTKFFSFLLNFCVTVSETLCSRVVSVISVSEKSVNFEGQIQNIV